MFEMERVGWRYFVWSLTERCNNSTSSTPALTSSEREDAMTALLARFKTRFR